MNENTHSQENLRIPFTRKRRSHVHDGMDTLEVFGDIVHSYVINRNGLEFISIGSKDLADKSNFSPTCCPKGEPSVLTKYITGEQVNIPSNSVTFF